LLNNSRIFDTPKFGIKASNNATVIAKNTLQENGFVGIASSESNISLYNFSTRKPLRGRLKE